jgi:hypothetical protein
MNESVERIYDEKRRVVCKGLKSENPFDFDEN